MNVFPENPSAKKCYEKAGFKERTLTENAFSFKDESCEELYIMKVIFLDIDGVLNSNFWNDTHQREISDGTLIDEEKVMLLGQLIRNTSAKVILHSGWKFWFDSEVKPLRREAERLISMLEKEGIKVNGVTPDHTTEEIRKSKKFSLVKASEILAWVSQYDNIEKWIVIDDLDLHNEEIRKHQILTDASIGLTVENICEAERLLL